MKLPFLYAHGALVWKTHREELAAALRFYRDRPARMPFEAIQLALRTRELSRAYGDRDEVSRSQAIIDRHYAPLSDPRIALALYLLSRSF